MQTTAVVLEKINYVELSNLTINKAKGAGKRNKGKQTKLEPYTGIIGKIT